MRSITSLLLALALLSGPLSCGDEDKGESGAWLSALGALLVWSACCLLAARAQRPDRKLLWFAAGPFAPLGRLSLRQRDSSNTVVL